MIEFLQATMGNRHFLCGAIVLTAVIMIVSDAMQERITFHLLDASDLLMVLLVARYLRVAEHDEFQTLIKGMLVAVVMLMVLMHTFG